MNEKVCSVVGGILLVTGCAVSLYGAHANNIWLDHNLALRVWSFANVIQMTWAIGLWRKWWNGGLPAIALCVLYGYYTVTNFIALENI
jgi:hypothetical protein